MAGDAHLAATRLIGKAYDPLTEVIDWLPSLLKETIAATGSVNGEIRLKPGALSLPLQDDEILLIDPNGACAVRGEIREDSWGLCLDFNGPRRNPEISNNFAGETLHESEQSNGSSIVTPIVYQGVPIGSLAIGSHSGYQNGQADLCRVIATGIAYHSKRYELRKLIKTQLGKDSGFIGTSKELMRIDEFIEKASRVDSPVLVLGEFGTEKNRLAYSLHYAGPGRSGRFVEVICSTLEGPTFRSQLPDLFNQARNGTIFFNGLDELKEGLQFQLVEFLETGFGEWADKENGNTSNVRMVASSNRPLDELVREGRFCRPLAWQFDFLQGRIPPLRERREDIKPLLQYFVQKYAIGSVAKARDEVLEICESYDWPGNDREMERVVARLVALSRGDAIEIDDLILHTPNLVKSVRSLKRVAVPRTIAAGNREPIARRQVDSSVISLVRSLIIEEKLTSLEAFHPAIQKALVYLARNSGENISIGQLATHACVSNSHLSHLFQKTLGANFKLFLALFRIEKSKQLMLRSPYASITNVAFEVGFGELRHFERTFKLLVGCTPREYKKELIEDRRSENLPCSLIARRRAR